VSPGPTVGISRSPDRKYSTRHLSLRAKQGRCYKGPTNLYVPPGDKILGFSAPLHGWSSPLLGCFTASPRAGQAEPLARPLSHVRSFHLANPTKLC
jgi:hypothetical protein